MKDRKIYCLNNIAKIGTDGFRSGYTLIDSIDEAAGVLVRSADMKEMSFPAGLRAIARAGAGVNNIPLERCAEEEPEWKEVSPGHFCACHFADSVQ